MQCQCQGIRYSRKRVNFFATGLAGASLMQNASQYKKKLDEQEFRVSVHTRRHRDMYRDIMMSRSCQDFVKLKINV